MHKTTFKEADTTRVELCALFLQASRKQNECWWVDCQGNRQLSAPDSKVPSPKADGQPPAFAEGVLQGAPSIWEGDEETMAHQVRSVCEVLRLGELPCPPAATAVRKRDHTHSGALLPSLHDPKGPPPRVPAVEF